MAYAIHGVELGMFGQTDGRTEVSQSQWESGWDTSALQRVMADTARALAEGGVTGGAAGLKDLLSPRPAPTAAPSASYVQYLVPAAVLGGIALFAYTQYRKKA